MREALYTDSMQRTLSEIRKKLEQVYTHYAMAGEY
jgi:hypothetical protein